MAKHKGLNKSSETVSPQEFYERTGLVDNLQKLGYVYIPCHDSKLLKKYRDQEFEADKQRFKDHRNLHKLKTIESDLVQHRTKWLEMEKEKINKWLKDKSNSSNEIEIEKYQKTVFEELKEIAKDKPKKQFPEYLLHYKKEVLAQKLKEEFKFEKGKIIRILIEVLKDFKLLPIVYGKKMDLYRGLMKYFDHDIGTYQSIFDYPYTESTNKPDIESVVIRLKSIIKSIKKQS